MNQLPGVMPLWNLRPGESSEVLGFTPALPERYQGRVMEFGFQPGTRVWCLLSPAFGAPRVYRISNSVFSLDRNVAEHVLVAPTDDSEAPK